MVAPPGLDLLHYIVGNGTRAQCHARMRPKGSSKKYTYVKAYPRDGPKDGIHLPITDAEICDHLAGHATYAVPLIGTDGLVSAALIELDRDHLEGAKSVQQAAQQRDVNVVSVATHGAGDHDGSHNWIVFAERVNPTAARLLAQQIAADAGYPNTETWPTKESIRLPFGRHTWTGDWGITLLPTGEIFDNNDPNQRSLALASVGQLPKNDAPPEPPMVATSTAASTLTKIVDHTAARAGTIAGFNNAGSLKADLEADGFSFDACLTSRCHCGGHDRQGNRPIKLIRSDNPHKSGEWVAVSYSTDCLIFPHFTSGHVMDRYGYAGTKGPVLLASQGSNGGKQVAQQVSEPRYTQAQRDAYNAARREQRHAENRAALDALAAHIAQLDLAYAVPRGVAPAKHSERAHLLIAYLLDLAHDAGMLQVRPTNDQIVEALGFCERYVIYAFRELEAAGVGKRHGGHGGLNQPNEAATWTFFRLPSVGCKSHTEAVCTLDLERSDSLFIPEESCEERPAPPARGEPMTWDEWEPVEDCHGTEELNTLAVGDTMIPSEPLAMIGRAVDALRPRVWRCGPRKHLGGWIGRLLINGC